VGPPDGVGQQRKRTLARCAGEGDPYASLLARDDRPCGIAERADLVEDPARRCQQPIALIGQAHTAGVAPEECQAELLLQLADAIAQGRLCHVEPCRGPAEVQLLRHGDERCEVTQIHDHLPDRSPENISWSVIGIGL
jgi:hypothetical protein